MMPERLQTRLLPIAPDLLAPDQSEIRLLTSLAGGSMVHCRLQSGAITIAVQHHTVEEHWYVLGGRGRLWRAGAEGEEVIELVAGLSCTIPLGVRFQFRNDDAEPLDILIVTMPPWPGADEASAVTGPWQPCPPSG